MKSLLPPALWLLAILPATAAPVWKTDVVPVFKQHCNGCHNPDKLKADLDLTSWETAMKGGSSGACITPGNADGSLLFRCVSHLEEPEMPPKKPKLGDDQLALIRDWIQGGAIGEAGSPAPKARDAALAMAVPAATENADTPPPMPGPGFPAAPDTLFARPAPVVMAASPRAPLVAVARRGGIALLHADTGAVLGALPSPARQVDVLHFSQDGTLLLAAGGHAAHSGVAAVFDVATGRQVATAGDYLTDTVLAAGLSPDLSLIATGGPDKLVRLYRSADGKLLHTIKKHTDWVTSVAFSPDGTKLATADRNGGLHLWDPATGTILYSLSEHQATVTSLAWRADSLILASGGDDGKLILWDTAEGWAAKSLTPHDAVKKDVPGRKTILLKVPGVLSAAFATDGKLVTAGRDNTVRVFRQNGGSLATLSDFPDLPTTAAFLPGNRIATGDYQGAIRLWQIDPKEKGVTATSTLTPAAGVTVP